MCKPASFVLTKTKVFWSENSDSHDDIIREHKLNESGTRGINILRVEIAPDDGNLIVYARGSATVTAPNSSIVYTHGSSTVKACESHKKRPVRTPAINPTMYVSNAAGWLVYKIGGRS